MNTVFIFQILFRTYNNMYKTDFQNEYMHTLQTIVL